MSYREWIAQQGLNNSLLIEAEQWSQERNDKRSPLTWASFALVVVNTLGLSLLWAAF